MRGVNVIFSFLIFFTIAVYFKYIVSNAGNNNKQKLESYLLEEHNSLFTRKRNIEDELFISPDMDTFPIVAYGNLDELSDENKSLYEKQSAVIMKASRKMLYLHNMSNLDIKKQYGVSKLDEISAYEKNYQDFVFAVYDWALALKKFEHISDSLNVLESLIDFGSNYSKSFIMLADFYFNNKECNKLLGLLDKTSLLEDIVKDKVENYINEYLSVLKK